MVDINRIEKVAKNISNIKEIKLEDCEVYYEFSVIVFYKDGKKDIIICDTSEEANFIYNCLKEKVDKQNDLKKPKDEKTF